MASTRDMELAVMLKAVMILQNKDETREMLRYKTANNRERPQNFQCMNYSLENKSSSSTV
jgi:hypothetical protein